MISLCFLFSLLSGFSDGTAAIHDVVNQTGNVKYTCKVVCKIDRHNRYKHKTSIQSVCWYPLDTGIFTTSGTDKLLKVWDTNNLIVSINMINENYKTLKLIRNTHLLTCTCTMFAHFENFIYCQRLNV